MREGEREGGTEYLYSMHNYFQGLREIRIGVLEVHLLREDEQQLLRRLVHDRQAQPVQVCDDFRLDLHETREHCCSRCLQNIAIFVRKLIELIFEYEQRERKRFAFRSSWTERRGKSFMSRTPSETRRTRVGPSATTSTLNATFFDLKA
jgi:hypothetical protein